MIPSNNVVFCFTGLLILSLVGLFLYALMKAASTDGE